MPSFRLTQAEMAVLMEHMMSGTLPLDQVAHSDLALDPALLLLARERLLDRGLLVRAPLEEVTGVASELAFVLATALNPDSVCVLRVTRRDGAGCTFHFSFSASSITLNYIDPQNVHVFTELVDLDHALDQMILLCGLELDPSRRHGAATEKLDTLLKAARTLVLLLVVTDLIDPDSTAHALSWLEADGGVWLVDGATYARIPLAQRLEVGQLRAILASMLAQDSVYHT